jgi:hypothetical protein
LTIAQASEVSGLSERELWTLIAQGKLVRSDDGFCPTTAEVYVPSLFRIVLETERQRQTPVGNSDSLSRELVGLCRLIAEQQKNSVRRTDELLDVFRQQRKAFENLREEQQQTFDQMFKFSCRMIETLTPKRKPPIWRAFFL